MGEIRDAEIHRLIGGALCLDFANTLHGHGRLPLHEYLTNYRDLVLWSRRAGILTDHGAKSLIREASRRPHESLVAFNNALTLRETIYRIFSAVAQGAFPKKADLHTLTEAHLEALTHSRLVRAESGFVWGWTNKRALDRMLWPIVLSAANLLTSETLRWVRECAGDGCDWLFIDKSRNRMRRWCTMDECGNRAKMRRRYARQRRQEAD
jgi:predicted RNA-binding Zn ribbon-like protein